MFSSATFLKLQTHLVCSQAALMIVLQVFCGSVEALTGFSKTNRSQWSSLWAVSEPFQGSFGRNGKEIAARYKHVTRSLDIYLFGSQTDYHSNKCSAICGLRFEEST